MYLLKPIKPWMAGIIVASTLGAAPVITVQAEATPASKEAGKKEEKPKTIAELTKDSKKISGLLSLYQNQKDGSVYWRISPKMLGKDIIHLVQFENGLAALDSFKGAYAATHIYRIERHFNRIDLVKQNPSFYFDPKSPLYRSAKANINLPISATSKILAEDKKSGDILIKADDIFLSEKLYQITPEKNPDEKPGERLGLGKISKDKTKFDSISGYPDNTDVVVNYTFDNPAPVRLKDTSIKRGNFAVTDQRSFNFKIRHSFVKAPENNFKPRYADPRIGYFTEYHHDMTSLSATPYRDVITRWHLEKKDKSAALSEPVEPITWWIENTTPKQFRQTIKDAVLAWNKAFEAAGFKNAVAVKVQPDDAKWEAGDLRYNVLRWTSSPQPVFSGYGPSFADPRTGQILGADIMLEFAGLGRRLHMRRIYEPASLTANGVFNKRALNESSLYNTAQFGVNALLAQSATDVEVDEFVKSFLYYLVLHEVGHTLGLNHNMRASQLWDNDKVHDKSLTESRGLTASVMDYPSINFAPKGVEQGQYYTSTPGAYDVWAIEYGYSPALDDPAAEKERLAKLLQKSSQPELAFGNDADDMRQPGKAIDPYVNIYDMSNEAVKYASDRLSLLQSLKKDLRKNLAKDGESYQALTDGYISLHQEYARNLDVISRYIGGVSVDRSFHGQKGAKQPFTVVPAEKQKEAMQALAEYAFAPGVFKSSESLLSHLQQQRRGFDFYLVTEDPKLHEMVLGMQKRVLDHLLHRSVMNRINDSALYGNEYKLDQVLAELTDAIFEDDARKNVESFRQNLQVEYVNRLIGIFKKPDGHHHINQSLSRYYLTQIKKMLKTRGNNVASTAHKEQLIYLIDKALDVKAG